MNWILEKAVNKTSFEMLKDPEIDLESLSKERVNRMIALRQYHFPLQYLLGNVEFLGNLFFVQLGVLIPRLETECLVQYAAKHIKANASILEIGIGSGVISLSLFLERQDLSVKGVDINPLAIDLSLKNKEQLVKSNADIAFFQSDLFTNITGQYDLIISNPPYITDQEYYSSDKELLFEPKDALITESDGLSFYEKLAEKAAPFLKEEGFIILEVSEYRIHKIISIFNNKMFSLQDTILDYLGLQRALVFKKNK